MDNIVINFVGDTTGLQPVENILTDIKQKGGEIGAAWKKASDVMTASTKTNTDASTKLSKAIDEIAIATKSMDKVAIGGAYKDYLKQIQSQLQLTNKEVANYVQNAKKAAQQAIISANTQEEADQLTLSIEVMNEQLQQLGQSEEVTETKTKSLRARLKEMREELVRLEDTGQDTSQRYVELSIEAGKLDDQVKDLNATISYLGSDTKHIDGLISLAGGVAGGFAVAQGAAALFGAENEDVQKALLKVNAAMGILQGLQQIQNVLQKESAGVLFLKNLFLQQSVVATTANTAATETAIIVEGEQVVATEAATVAQVGLNTAMEANPIALLIIAIGALVGAIGYFTESTNEAEEANKKYEQSLKDQEERLKSLAEKYGELTAEQDRNSKLIIAKANASGASQEELLKIEQKLAQRRIDNMKLEQAELIASERYTEETSRRYQELTKSILDAENDLKVQSLNNQSELNKKKADKQKEAADKAADIAKKNADALFEIEKRRIQGEIDLDKQLYEGDNTPFQFRLQSLEKYQKDETALLKLQRDKDLADKTLTGLQRLNIEDKFSKDLKGLIDSTFKTRNEIIKKYNDDLKAQEAKDLEDIYNTEVAKVEAFFAKLKTGNSTNENKELEDQKKLYDQGTITLAEYEENRKKIKERHGIYNNNNEAARLKELIAINENADKDITALQDQLYKVLDVQRQKNVDDDKNAEVKITDNKKKEMEKRMQAIQLVFSILQKSLQDTIGTTGFSVAITEIENFGIKAQDVFAKIKDGTLTIKEGLQEMAKGAATALQSITAQIFADNAAQRQQALQDALSVLEQEKQKELDNKNLTEDQKAAIEKKYRDRERQEKLRAFNAEKDAKKQQALINGFLAFTAALPNFILAGIALGAALIQVAAIDKIKPPKFRHGKIDIDGPGTTTSDSIPAFISRGESVIKADSTAKWKDALLAINNDTFDTYLKNKFADFIFPKVPEYVKPNISNSSIDYEKLATAVADKMKGIMPGEKSTHVTIDEHGIRTLVIEKHAQTEIKNKRYSMS